MTSKFRTEREMLELITHTAEEDERILAAVMSGSRADIHAVKDVYQDYDIVYYVKDVAPFWNNNAWLEEKFGKIAVLQTPETMTLMPPDNNGAFVFLTIFEDGNRIDLTISDNLDIPEGEPAVVLLDKVGMLSDIRPRNDYWFVKPPTEKLFRDCCNEFWWCLNNVAKGVARDELPYAMEMFNLYVRDMLNQMTDWYIGITHDFKVSAGKMGKNYKRYLPEEMYRQYAATYSDSDYGHIRAAVYTGCDLFRTMAKSVAERFGYEYNLAEDENMTAYMRKTMGGHAGRFVSEIFGEKPAQWGLRGDPFLWERLQKRYADVRLPYPSKALKLGILQTFAEFAGECPERGKIYYAEEFAKKNVGMSTGGLSGDFWLNTAIPLLLERLNAVNSELGE